MVHLKIVNHQIWLRIIKLIITGPKNIIETDVRETQVDKNSLQYYATDITIYKNTAPYEL